jgi:hypothetical protein
MKKLFLLLVLVLLFVACAQKYKYPAWIPTGSQWCAVTGDTDNWYFHEEVITNQYQDPSYNYIEVLKYLDYYADVTPHMIVNDNLFTFDNVKVTKISDTMVSIERFGNSKNFELTIK